MRLIAIMAPSTRRHIEAIPGVIRVTHRHGNSYDVEVEPEAYVFVRETLVEGKKGSK